MRILMLAQFYKPDIGGEERLVQDLSVELVRRGHEVAVATLWHKGLAEFEIDQGIRIYRIHGIAQRVRWLFTDPGRRHAPPWPDPEILRSLQRVIEQERPEIVHAHNWLAYSFLPLKRWSRACFVRSLHDYSLVCAQKRLMRRGTPCTGPGFSKCLTCASNHYGALKGIPVTLSNWIMGAVERRVVDMYLPVSLAAATNNGLNEGHLPFQVLPNFIPVDTDEVMDVIDPYLAQLPEEDYLLFVGDLSRDKGIEVLLHAYGQLVKPPPLVLIGRRCADTPVDFPHNVIWMNSWPHQAVLAAWKRSIIGLIPSVVPETFGIVALEAMMAGRPVIASRTGGLLDIVVDGENGFLVPPNDSVALHLALERLLGDPELRERMGQAGKHMVAKYKANTIVPLVEQVYEKILAPISLSQTAGKSKGSFPNAEA